MLDIKEVFQDFQKLNKTENCIVIVLKNDTKIAITSPVSITADREWSGVTEIYTPVKIFSLVSRSSVQRLLRNLECPEKTTKLWQVN